MLRANMPAHLAHRYLLSACKVPRHKYEASHCGVRELAGAPAPAVALAAFESLLKAADDLADDAAAWPTLAPVLRALALQAGQHHLDAVGGTRPSSSTPELDKKECKLVC